MTQSDHEKPDLVPQLTFWATVLFFGLGIWLEFRSPGVAIIGASIMSWLGHFTDWITEIFEIRYGAKE